MLKISLIMFKSQNKEEFVKEKEQTKKKFNFSPFSSCTCSCLCSCRCNRHCTSILFYFLYLHDVLQNKWKYFFVLCNFPFAWQIIPSCCKNMGGRQPSSSKGIDDIVYDMFWYQLQFSFTFYHNKNFNKNFFSAQIRCRFLFTLYASHVKTTAKI